MKKVLILAGCLCLCASVALADHIGLYNELAGTNCFRAAAWVPDGGSNFVYVIQKFNTGSTGSEFKINNTSGAPYSSFTLGTATFLTIGTPETGLSVAYNACMASAQFVIIRLRYADDDLLGLAPTPCGKMEVVEDPGAIPPVRQTADCNSNPHPATGGSFYWGTGCPGCADPTATEKTTWGGVKALYR
jgi:hypothetical protein